MYVHCCALFQQRGKRLTAAFLLRGGPCRAVLVATPPTEEGGVDSCMEKNVSHGRVFLLLLLKLLPTLCQHGGGIFFVEVHTVQVYIYMSALFAPLIVVQWGAVRKFNAVGPYTKYTSRFNTCCIIYL